jgi:hypothetical protein
LNVFISLQEIIKATMTRTVVVIVTIVCLALLSQQKAAYARITPAKAFVSSSTAGPKAEQSTSWGIGDVLVASHNAVGFPRVDVLDPSDFTVKDSVDLVPVCGGQSQTRGISFSPRFSSMKLQLAVSCAPDSEEAQGQDGKVVFIAAKAAQHPVLRTLQIQSPGASVFNKAGTLYVFGKHQQAAAAVAVAGSNASSSVATGAAGQPASRQLLVAADNATEPAAHLANRNVSLLPATTSQPQQLAGVVNSKTAAAAAPPPPEQLVQAPPTAAKPKMRAKTPTVLFKLEAPPSPAALAATDKQQDGSLPTAAAAVPQVAAVMPSWISSSEHLSLDLGPKGSKLYYTLGKNMLRTYDTDSGQHLPDRQLPAGNCLGILAQFDETLFVACGKCLFHLPTSDKEPPLRHACLDMSASFGRHMALDATGSHLLISTLDGGLHSVQVGALGREVQCT